MTVSRPDIWFFLVSSIGGIAFTLVFLRAAFLKRNQEKKFPFYHVSLRSGVVKTSIAVLAIAFLFTALLEPRIVEQEFVSVPYRDARVLVLLDISRSMHSRKTPTSPTRLLRAKSILERSLVSIDRSPVSLYTFSRVSLPRVPFTRDYPYISDTLDGITKIPAFPIPGSDITNALLVSAKSLSKETADTKVIVLITEGEHRAVFQRSEYIAVFQENDIKLVVLGIGENGERIPIFENGTFTGRYERLADGTEYVSSLNEDFLKQITQSVSGEYFHESDSRSFAKALEDAVKTSPTIEERKEFQYREYSLAPQFFLASATLFLVLFVWKYT